MSSAFGSVSTKSFSRLLCELSASIVVTTYQSGKLIVASPDAQGLNTHLTTVRKPMGVSVSGNRMALATFQHIKEYTRSEDGFVVQVSLRTGNQDVHELEYDKDGNVWFVNTKQSSVCKTDMRNVSEVWQPPFVTSSAEEDRCHLNGLGMRDGVPRYVTMLGMSDEKEGWRTAAGGALMDISDNSILASGLAAPHSPRWYRDALFFLESGTGKLCKIVDGIVETICVLPGFLRGMDFVGDYAFVGSSIARGNSAEDKLPTDVASFFCGVWIININTGAKEAYLKFTGDVTELFSVKTVPADFRIADEIF